MHGGPTSECPDDERDWYPQRDICWPAAQLAAAHRLYGLIHSEAPYHDGSFKRWAKKASREFPFHYLDGVTIRLAETDEHPGDDFLGPTTTPITLGDQDPDEPEQPDDGVGDGDYDDGAGESWWTEPDDDPPF